MQINVNEQLLDLECPSCGGKNIKKWNSTPNDKGRTRYKCMDCHRAFLQRKDYKKELKELKDKADFCCPNCGDTEVYTSFRMKSDKNRQRYKCYGCNTTFLRPSELVRFNKLPMVSVDFNCPVCGADRTKVGFNRRRKDKNTGNVRFVYKCEECKKTFLNPAEKKKAGRPLNKKCPHGEDGKEK